MKNKYETRDRRLGSVILEQTVQIGGSVGIYLTFEPLSKVTFGSEPIDKDLRHTVRNFVRTGSSVAKFRNHYFT